MSINLPPITVDAISTLQKNPMMVSMITDTEDFLIEHCDDESLSHQVLANIKGLRMIRRLLENICCIESTNT